MEFFTHTFIHSSSRMTTPFFFYIFISSSEKKKQQEIAQVEWVRGEKAF